MVAAGRGWAGTKDREYSSGTCACAADGTLRFNWRVAMLHPALIEYIVVHELAHLTVMNHSADFWDLMAGALPDVQLRRRQLREVGRLLLL